MQMGQTRFIPACSVHASRSPEFIFIPPREGFSVPKEHQPLLMGIVLDNHIHVKNKYNEMIYFVCTVKLFKY